MATKSILKDIVIRDKRLAEGLVFALENAENKSAKKVILDRRLDEVKGVDVKTFFESQT